MAHHVAYEDVEVDEDGHCSSNMEANMTQAGALNPQLNDPATSSKRKLDDDDESAAVAQPPARSKRNRYISVACNECKRRKIKCNGQTPCDRCGRMNFECKYTQNCCSVGLKDSEEFRQMKAHIESLQEQVDTLFRDLNNLKNRNATPSATNGSGASPSRSSLSIPQIILPDQSPVHRHQTPSQSTHYPGTPASPGFDVVQASLQAKSTVRSDELATDGLLTRSATPKLSSHGLSAQPIVLHPTKDPLWAIGKEEAVRLCSMFNEEITSMYPIIDHVKITRQTSSLFSFLDAAVKSGFARPDLPGADGMFDDNSNVIKMVLATALILEGKGSSEPGQRLFESIRPIAEQKLWKEPDMSSLKLLTIVSIYSHQRGNEVCAWRTIGFAARLCLELGLHCKQSLARLYPKKEDCSAALNVFWCIYCLDRRWSFGTGLPLAIQDSDIDNELPLPVLHHIPYWHLRCAKYTSSTQDEQYAYLRAMVQYNRLGSRVWKSVTGFPRAIFAPDEMEYLDFQVQQWYRQIPNSLKLSSPEVLPQLPSFPTNESRTTRRLRVVLHLHASQMRMLVYRPVLLSIRLINANIDHATTAASIAQNTIHLLSALHEQTDLYRTQQQLFNCFLLSAVEVILLAVIHAPNKFRNFVHEEIHVALELVRDFGTDSNISKRLWRMIRSLREMIGAMNPPDSNGQQECQQGVHPQSQQHRLVNSVDFNKTEIFSPNSSITPTTSSASQSQSFARDNTPIDDAEISRELTNLFDVAAAIHSHNLQTRNSESPKTTEGVAASLVASAGPNGSVLDEGGSGSEEAVGNPTNYPNENEFPGILKDLY